jgi:hypothetical protein
MMRGPWARRAVPQRWPVATSGSPVGRRCLPPHTHSVGAGRGSVAGRRCAVLAPPAASARKSALYELLPRPPALRRICVESSPVTAILPNRPYDHPSCLSLSL